MSPTACRDHSTQKKARLQNQFPFLSTVTTVASVRCFFEFRITLSSERLSCETMNRKVSQGEHGAPCDDSGIPEVKLSDH